MKIGSSSANVGDMPIIPRTYTAAFGPTAVLFSMVCGSGTGVSGDKISGNFRWLVNSATTPYMRLTLRNIGQRHASLALALPYEMPNHGAIDTVTFAVEEAQAYQLTMPPNSPSRKSHL